MQFNSLAFLTFLPIVLLLYYRLRNRRAQNLLLLAASYVFYGWWDWRFLGLILFTTTVDYTCGRGIGATTDPVRRRAWLLVSLLTDLGVLGFFKYFNFFLDSAADLLALFGLHAGLPALRIVLPVGISFYTFQSMSYTIDVYRGRMSPVRSFPDFALFVSFFPQLVAGPVERAVHLLPQLQGPRTIRAADVADGLWLIMLGYLKKLVIADRLAQYVDAGFQGGFAPASGAEAWLRVYAFAVQIYCDFSAYSDIARGVGKLLGVDLMVNFRAPYLVRDPASFWRHWHISLSTWLRDYLYIPLGGNRLGRARTYGNLMVTMLLGGLWHGAGWAFVLWGLYHGALLAGHRFLREGTPRRPPGDRAGIPLLRVVQTMAFFHLTCIGWLIFRVGSVGPGVDQLGMIRTYLAQMVQPVGWPAWGNGPGAVLLLGGLALALQWRQEAMECFSAWRPWRQVLAVAAAVIAIETLAVFEGAQFIYFQF